MPFAASTDAAALLRARSVTIETVGAAEALGAGDRDQLSHVGRSEPIESLPPEDGSDGRIRLPSVSQLLPREDH